MVEGLRPDLVVVTPTGQAVIADLRDLLPVPLPPDAALRGTPYTAPELILRPDAADATADLYGFGAMIYALMLGRELTELDFTAPGVPRPFLERFPDAHPLLGRLVSKTFCREPELRFPTECEPGDPDGLGELVHLLDACRRNAARVRLDVASWTTTGIVRGGNEDAVAVHHASEGRLEEIDESALLLLADGMGGVESGEVAAAIAIQTARRHLLDGPPFTGAFHPAGAAARGPASERLLGAAAEKLADDAAEAAPTLDGAPALPAPGSLMVDPAARQSPHRSVEAHQERMLEAVRRANHQVHEAALHGLGNRGMGCTLVAVLIDGSDAVIGHVGDSRTYHLGEGRLTQVSRDQTLVNRLVELGHITAEEAETHPRRSELQQAVGGRPDVYPELYHRRLQPGDWLLVCSDGLTNQLRPATIEKILLESPSAEKAARRLVNRANLEGALDNVSVIVVRAV
jgi:protein phosphatase